MKMKWFLLVAVAMVFSATANAQEHKKDQKTPEERAELMTEKMKEKLDLSEEQYDKIQKLNAEHAVEMKQLHEKMKSLRDEVKATREKHLESLRGELTEEQRAKFDEHIEKMKDKRDHHHGGPHKGEHQPHPHGESNE